MYDEAMRWIKRYELEIATLQERPQLELQPRDAVGWGPAGRREEFRGQRKHEIPMADGGLGSV